MSKSKATRKVLFCSVVSLILCISMLVGTTFAWFTDTATSGTNQIVTGKLDIELYHNPKGAAAEDPAQLVKEDTELFKIARWEPGAVVYENFKIVNAGTLSLKYAFCFNPGQVVKNYVVEKAGETTTTTSRSLADVLYIKIVVGSVTAPRPAYTDGVKLSDFLSNSTQYIDEGSLDVDAEKDIAVVLYWPQSGDDNLYNLQNGWYASATENGTDPDNENPALYIKLPISLNATQGQMEVDSFGNDYDSSAEISYLGVIDRDTNVARDADNVIASGSVDEEREHAGLMFDGNTSTKWCDEKTVPGGMQVTFTLAKPMVIGEWRSYHAMVEDRDYFVTRDFRLQVLNTEKISEKDYLAMSDDQKKAVQNDPDNWKDLDVVTNNTANIVTREIDPNKLVKAQVYRLYVDKSQQEKSPWGGGWAARINELELYAYTGSLG